MGLDEVGPRAPGAPPRAPLRVVIAEDEALLREGLQLLLTRAGMEVAEVVGNAVDLLAAADRCRPDVVLTDIRMPPGSGDDGLRAAIQIRRSQPRIGVIVLSQHVERHYALELVADNPRGVGYLLKQRIADVDRFCDDVRTVAAGGTALDPEVIDTMMRRAQHTRPDLARLTDRQYDVLSLVAQGHSNAAIAARLRITERAVVQHISHTYDELGLPNTSSDHRRVLAAVRYLVG